ncbi:hypothetical protein TPA0598_08_00380 [Streptomyces lydicamycinicus]|uniref:Uncharacterized protein n=1 Tax=Streptomyces lydicamycinicus TaxID=1546107 RepID=A0A0P4RC25_9ACTN|nr:hypothetical protein TPA0598_08_00380 [Streptomyces lydicamycinicus]
MHRTGDGGPVHSIKLGEGHVRELKAQNDQRDQHTVGEHQPVLRTGTECPPPLPTTPVVPRGVAANSSTKPTRWARDRPQQAGWDKAARAQADVTIRSTRAAVVTSQLTAPLVADSLLARPTDQCGRDTPEAESGIEPGDVLVACRQEDGFHAS